MRTVIFLSIVILGSLFPETSLLSQTIATRQPALPTVFLLGENDVAYTESMPAYATLLDVCDGNMETAFDKLSAMMREMEAYALTSNYDLKGVQLWMHFFFRKDGSIEHIGFHLKPSSKNVDKESLKVFLAGFAKRYKFSLTAEAKYAHYSSFSFPIVRPSLPDRDTRSAVQKVSVKNY
ncbi:MAG: hypothetical protein AAB316_22260 [Bacteroidota bacterium]